MNEQAPKPKKEDWPRTKHGTIDWEAVFERPGTGLIELIEQTTTGDGILQVSKVIIHSLFSRQDDAENRINFENEVNGIMTARTDPGASFDLEPRKVLIIALMREIKMNRVLCASFHVARLKEGEKDEEAERRADPADGASAEAADEGGLDRANPASTEAAFGIALREMLGRRLEALREDVAQGPLGGKPLPFPVSEAFAERLLDIVHEHFAPEMQASCRPFIRQAESFPAAEQVDFISQSLENRKNREALWTAWQKVWEEMTRQQDPPKKPKAQKKKGLLDKLKKEKKPSWKGEPMTIEEWEDAVAITEQGNQLAARIWDEITAPADDFRPPEDADNKLLMNLFARTAGAMGKQVTAVRQIAEQGGNAAKTFADYQQGKDMDLPLLAVVCQRPDLFLDQGLLKDFMRSFPDAMQRDRFGLVLRFFGDHF